MKFRQLGEKYHVEAVTSVWGGLTARVVNHVAGIDKCLAAFEKFKTEHPERMKQPGTTRGR
jgi:hypothetical protein